MLFLTSPQEAVQQMRAIDDRIIYKLNTSIPTISFADEVSAKDQCKKLYDQVWKITYPGHMVTLLFTPRPSRIWYSLCVVSHESVLGRQEMK